MCWYLKHGWRFVSAIPSTFYDSVIYHRWSRHSRGLLRDIVEFQVLNWADLVTAYSLHRRVRRPRKR